MNAIKKMAIMTSTLIFLCSGLTNLYAKKRENLEMKRINTPNGSIQYMERGEGDPMIVIGSSIYDSRTFSKKLGKKFHMVFVDLRANNMTLTPEQEQATTFEMVLDEIETVRKALDLEDVIIAGHSIHGAIAYEYARAYPENVSNVVMIGTPQDGAYGNPLVMENWEAKADAYRKEQYEITKQKLAEIDFSQLSYRDQLVVPYVLNPAWYWHDPTYDCSHLWQGVEINQVPDEIIYGRLFSYNILDHLDGEISEIPVLVVLGESDFVVPEILWENFENPHGNFKIVTIKRSGHSPQYERPRKFKKVLRRWLKATN